MYHFTCKIGMKKNTQKNTQKKPQQQQQLKDNYLQGVWIIKWTPFIYT